MIPTGKTIRPTKTLLRSGKFVRNRPSDWTAPEENGPDDLLFNVQGDPWPVEPPRAHDSLAAPAGEPGTPGKHNETA